MKTYGFYPDISYDQDDIGSMFEGLIGDGVYMSVGDAFKVSVNDLGSLKVGTGRAMFNNTWFKLKDPMVLNRLDFPSNNFNIVIEINKSTKVNSIKMFSGDASTNYDPVIADGFIYRYKIAHISLPYTSSNISADMITNLVGKGSCPYVAGIMQTFDISTIIDPLEAEWEKFISEKTKEINDKKEELTRYIVQDLGNQFLLWLNDNNNEFNKFLTDSSAQWQKIKLDCLSEWEDLKEGFVNEVLSNTDVENKIQDIESKSFDLYVMLENIEQRIEDEGSISSLISNLALRDKIEYLQAHSILDSGSEIDVDETFYNNLFSPVQHRNIFRGKSLGTTFTDEQKKAIKDGTFYDLFVGDYWTINDVKWRIADMDYWMGDQEITNILVNKHHLVLIPDESIRNSPLYRTDEARNGFKNSTLMRNLHNAAIGTPLKFFGENYLLSFSDVFWSISDSTSKVYNWSYNSSRICLLNSAMIFGTTRGNISHNFVDLNSLQLSLFRLDPSFIFMEKDTSYKYWLEDPGNTSGSNFGGLAAMRSPRNITVITGDNLTTEYGIRPCVGITGGE